MSADQLAMINRAEQDEQRAAKYAAIAESYRGEKQMASDSKRIRVIRALQDAAAIRMGNAAEIRENAVKA